jgi:GDPmannose 4,6-dehydratase
LALVPWWEMKTVCISGITGQDGWYLTELALSEGYRVVGVVRDLSRSGSQLRDLFGRGVELAHWDFIDPVAIQGILEAHRPEKIFNLAAFSTGDGMYKDPIGIGEVNGLAVVKTLEAIREVDTAIRFCQASSREVFGEPTESPQTELTALNPRSPYGAAKMYADAMIRIYRQRYGLFASSAILYNHESPRRGLSFITRKITHAAVNIKLGLAQELTLGNLDARRDWGHAADYVRGMWLMLQQAQPDDYVLASGASHSVRDVCRVAFEELDLDYRDYVREDPTLFRPSEPLLLMGDAGKARRKLGWTPLITFREMVCEMVAHDLALATNTSQH